LSVPKAFETKRRASSVSLLAQDRDPLTMRDMPSRTGWTGQRGQSSRDDRLAFRKGKAAL